MKFFLKTSPDFVYEMHGSVSIAKKMARPLGQHRTRTSQVDTERLRAWLVSDNKSMTMLEESEFTRNRVFVATLHDQYTSISAKCIAASCPTASYSQLHGAVTTFFESPAVQYAFYQFVTERQSGPSASATETDLVRILTGLEPAFHNGSIAVPAVKVVGENERRITQLALDYLSRVERWRRIGTDCGLP